ncbi:hypothetical protein ACIBL6_22995 [Streptomyces sp. NPDC050400]|uniref:hypothetical protein n=1 Tax=Streptomyces sp. NPDC050400 TaxID=3365610 RepID=UPI0037A9923C
MSTEWSAGALVVDTDTGKTGRVMGSVGPYVQLRQPGGGREGTPTRAASVRPTKPKS